MTAQAIEAKANVRWWPSSLVDEDMPTGLATPMDWLLEEEGSIYLGVDEPGWREAWGWVPVTVGEEIEFIAAENLCTLIMTIAEDGGFHLDRDPPPSATHWYPDEAKNLFDTPEELAAHLFEAHGDGVFEVEAFHWGDDVSHRMERGPDGLRFVPVEVA